MARKAAKKKAVTRKAARKPKARKRAVPKPRIALKRKPPAGEPAQIHQDIHPVEPTPELKPR